ncbi:hypothetical protein AMQ83_23685 [Paenibacillus riograndensis]|nr:hypothetical protein AMQ83_23685 [Paenibacillus riograndensis]
MVEALFEICFGQKEFFLSLIKANLYGEFQTRLANILSQKLSFVKERTGFFNTTTCRIHGGCWSFAL